MNKLPFLPDRSAIDPLRDFRKALTVKAVSAVTNRSVNDVAARLYPKDAEVIAKAAVAPIGTDNAGALVGVRVGPFLRSLRARSAAANLFDLSPFNFDLRGAGSITVPALAANGDFPNAAWVGEGAPIPVYRGALASVSLVPRKLAALSALTNELAEHSAETAEQVVSDLLQDSVSRALDAKVFSTDAATPIAPAGLLNGVTAITGATGGGITALASDLRALAAAVATGGGGTGLVIIASPAQALTMQILSGKLAIPVLASAALANGTVIMLDVGAFASAFSGDPRIDVVESAVIHYEDANPQQIGTTGTPNVVASPARSAFQTDVTVLRCILRASFAMRAPAIAFTTTATW